MTEATRRWWRGDSEWALWGGGGLVVVMNDGCHVNSHWWNLPMSILGKWYNSWYV